ncbi:hypothetical protein PoB_001023500 [Plakobranchus ocellatus]|uniref:Uncharacterized protein n=1 Tax=Plakobranchus ocellatus TaxID=259542 RepID=A0AAV3YLY1_9GAST|nr:hypothetical protein PoB_001023500 [Plakobranchus ocellatus]
MVPADLRADSLTTAPQTPPNIGSDRIFTESEKYQGKKIITVNCVWCALKVTRFMKPYFNKSNHSVQSHPVPRGRSRSSMAFCKSTVSSRNKLVKPLSRTGPDNRHKEKFISKVKDLHDGKGGQTIAGSDKIYTRACSNRFGKQNGPLSKRRPCKYLSSSPEGVSKDKNTHTLQRNEPEDCENKTKQYKDQDSSPGKRDSKRFDRKSKFAIRRAFSEGAPSSIRKEFTQKVSASQPTVEHRNKNSDRRTLRSEPNKNRVHLSVQPEERRTTEENVTYCAQDSPPQKNLLVTQLLAVREGNPSVDKGHITKVCGASNARNTHVSEYSNTSDDKVKANTEPRDHHESCANGACCRCIFSIVDDALSDRGYSEHDGTKKLCDCSAEISGSPVRDNADKIPNENSANIHRDSSTDTKSSSANNCCTSRKNAVNTDNDSANFTCNEKNARNKRNARKGFRTIHSASADRRKANLYVTDGIFKRATSDTKPSFGSNWCKNDMSNLASKKCLRKKLEDKTHRFGLCVETTNEKSGEIRRLEEKDSPLSNTFDDHLQSVIEYQALLAQHIRCLMSELNQLVERAAKASTEFSHLLSSSQQGHSNNFFQPGHIQLDRDSDERRAGKVREIANKFENSCSVCRRSVAGNSLSSRGQQTECSNSSLTRGKTSGSVYTSSGLDDSIPSVVKKRDDITLGPKNDSRCIHLGQALLALDGPQSVCVQTEGVHAAVRYRSGANRHNPSIDSSENVTGINKHSSRLIDLLREMDTWKEKLSLTGVKSERNKNTGGSATLPASRPLVTWSLNPGDMVKLSSSEFNCSSCFPKDSAIVTGEKQNRVKAQENWEFIKPLKSAHGEIQPTDVAEEAQAQNKSMKVSGERSKNEDKSQCRLQLTTAPKEGVFFLHYVLLFVTILLQLGVQINSGYFTAY